MAKISPVSIKYMIHASFSVEGALEKPDVIGAIFGQTEGLLGSDLEMRELQKEGKIGRIEVDLERSDKRTSGIIKIPTALDQSETTLIAAAIETIERIGPCDSQIEVDKIEDVRGSKRDYIVDRAKKLMQNIKGSTDSREISNEIKDSTKMAEIKEYGESKLPCGNLSDKEIIVVEGRADVLNLLRNGVKNVIAMNGTKLPGEIKELGREKDLTLFIDGDRGGKLIAQNVTDNAEVKYIATAPDGKEVEELTNKEILMQLRKKVEVEEFFAREKRQKTPRRGDDQEKLDINEEDKEKLKKIFQENKDSEKAIILDDSLNETKNVSVRGLSNSLRNSDRKIFAIVIDGTVTSSILKTAEDAGCKIIAAKNFASNDTNIQLLGF
ncbi:MAG: DNA primase [Nanoarchaeota archaeon]|nr:DNA primase [Nanoarchaeota archaeon]MBU1027791.1 DNA primase [Nanoarchaeota archaeon]